MPRVLWVNLDPGWPFARMLRDHCLDWIAREEIWIWDVCSPSTERESPWADWPTQLAPDGLLDALHELPPMQGGRLLAVHAPILGDGDSKTRNLLAGLIAHVRDNPQWTLMLSLPENADAEPSRALGVEGKRIARLANDPRLRVRSQRLLIEMLRDPELADDQRRLPSQSVVDVTLVSDDGAPVQDQVSALWQAAIPDLLDQVARLERAETLAQGQDERGRLVDEITRAGALRQALSCASPHAPPADKLQLEALRASRFFDQQLPARLHRARTSFLAAVDEALNERWLALVEERKAFELNERRQDADLDRLLTGWKPSHVGYGDSSLDRLKAWQRQINEEISATEAGSERLAREISRSVRRAGEARDGGYVRHRFAEDDAFDDKVEAAKRVSARLIRLSTLIWGGLGLTLLALVPVLALRLPQWLLGTGPWWPNYLAYPDRWLFDLAWILPPGTLWLAWGFAIADRRRSELARALDEARAAADQLWRRHAAVLNHLCDYVGHRAAMRRLTLLDGHVKRLERRLREGRDFLRSLEQELQRQQRDYEALGVPALAAAPSSDRLFQAMVSEPTPLRWLMRLAPVLDEDPERVVAIDDQRITNAGLLRTGYLLGETRLRLDEVEP